MVIVLHTNTQALSICPFFSRYNYCMTDKVIVLQISFQKKIRFLYCKSLSMVAFGLMEGLFLCLGLSLLFISNLVNSFM